MNDIRACIDSSRTFKVLLRSEAQLLTLAALVVVSSERTVYGSHSPHEEPCWIEDVVHALRETHIAGGMARALRALQKAGLIEFGPRDVQGDCGEGQYHLTPLTILASSDILAEDRRIRAESARVQDQRWSNILL